MSDTHDNLVSRLRTYLYGEPDLLLAYVFGSVAEGHQRPDSDLDVAVYPKQALTSERKAELISALARIAGRPVDVIDLRTAGPHIARQAIRGRLLFTRSPAIKADLIFRTLVDVADFLPYRQRLLKERREQWIHRS